MFKRSTMALDHLSPALESVVLQTGAKMCVSSATRQGTTLIQTQVRMPSFGQSSNRLYSCAAI